MRAKEHRDHDREHGESHGGKVGKNPGLQVAYDNQVRAEERGPDSAAHRQCAAEANESGGPIFGAVRVAH